MAVPNVGRCRRRACWITRALGVLCCTALATTPARIEWCGVCVAAVAPAHDTKSFESIRIAADCGPDLYQDVERCTSSTIAATVGALECEYRAQQCIRDPDRHGGMAVPAGAAAARLPPRPQFWLTAAAAWRARSDRGPFPLGTYHTSTVRVEARDAQPLPTVWGHCKRCALRVNSSRAWTAPADGGAAFHGSEYNLAVVLFDPSRLLRARGAVPSVLAATQYDGHNFGLQSSTITAEAADDAFGPAACPGGAVVGDSPVFVLHDLHSHGHLLMYTLEGLYNAMISEYGRVRRDAVLVIGGMVLRPNQDLAHSAAAFAKLVNSSAGDGAAASLLRLFTRRPLQSAVALAARMETEGAVCFGDLHVGVDRRLSTVSHAWSMLGVDVNVADGAEGSRLAERYRTFQRYVWGQLRLPLGSMGAPVPWPLWARPGRDGIGDNRDCDGGEVPGGDCGADAGESGGAGEALDGASDPPLHCAPDNSTAGSARERPVRVLFVDRGQQARRRITNMVDLVEATSYDPHLRDLASLCAARGTLTAAPIEVRAVRLHELPMSEQMRALNEAHVVVGMRGSGLHNMLFCRPGTVIVMVAMPGWCEKSAEFVTQALLLGLHIVSVCYTDDVGTSSRSRLSAGVHASHADGGSEHERPGVELHSDGRHDGEFATPRPVTAFDHSDFSGSLGRSSSPGPSAGDFNTAAVHDLHGDVREWILPLEQRAPLRGPRRTIDADVFVPEATWREVLGVVAALMEGDAQPAMKHGVGGNTAHGSRHGVVNDAQSPKACARGDGSGGVFRRVALDGVPGDPRSCGRHHVVRMESSMPRPESDEPDNPVPPLPLVGYDERSCDRDTRTDHWEGCATRVFVPAWSCAGGTYHFSLAIAGCGAEPALLSSVQIDQRARSGATRDDVPVSATGDRAQPSGAPGGTRRTSMALDAVEVCFAALRDLVAEFGHCVPVGSVLENGQFSWRPRARAPPTGRADSGSGPHVVAHGDAVLAYLRHPDTQERLSGSETLVPLSTDASVGSVLRASLRAAQEPQCDHSTVAVNVTGAVRATRWHGDATKLMPLDVDRRSHAGALQRDVASYCRTAGLDIDVPHGLEACLAAAVSVGLQIGQLGKQELGSAEFSSSASGAGWVPSTTRGLDSTGSPSSVLADAHDRVRLTLGGITEDESPSHRPNVRMYEQLLRRCRELNPAGRSMLAGGFSTGALFVGGLLGYTTLHGVARDHEAADMANDAAAVAMSWGSRSVWRTALQGFRVLGGTGNFSSVVTEATEGRYDVVIALALVHRLYAAGTFGGLCHIVGELARRVAPGGHLVIEWIDPSDPGIDEVSRAALASASDAHQRYDREEFVSALLEHFTEVEMSAHTDGDVSPGGAATREQFVAWGPPSDLSSTPGSSSAARGYRPHAEPAPFTLAYGLGVGATGQPAIVESAQAPVPRAVRITVGELTCAMVMGRTVVEVVPAGSASAFAGMVAVHAALLAPRCAGRGAAIVTSDARLLEALQALVDNFRVDAPIELQLRLASDSTPTALAHALEAAARRMPDQAARHPDTSNAKDPLCSGLVDSSMLQLPVAHPCETHAEWSWPHKPAGESHARRATFDFSVVFPRWCFLEHGCERRSGAAAFGDRQADDAQLVREINDLTDQVLYSASLETGDATVVAALSAARLRCASVVLDGDQPGAVLAHRCPQARTATPALPAWLAQRSATGTGIEIAVHADQYPNALFGCADSACALRRVEREAKTHADIDSMLESFGSLAAGAAHAPLVWTKTADLDGSRASKPWRKKAWVGRSRPDVGGTQAVADLFLTAMEHEFNAVAMCNALHAVHLVQASRRWRNTVSAVRSSTGGTDPTDDAVLGNDLLFPLPVLSMFGPPTGDRPQWSLCVTTASSSPLPLFEQYGGVSDPSVAVRATVRLLVSLAMMAQAGVFHRDIHYGNVLGSRDTGTTSLVDFDQSAMRAAAPYADDAISRWFVPPWPVIDEFLAVNHINRWRRGNMAFDDSPSFLSFRPPPEAADALRDVCDPYAVSVLLSYGLGLVVDLDEQPDGITVPARDVQRDVALAAPGLAVSMLANVSKCQGGSWSAEDLLQLAARVVRVHSDAAVV